MCAEGVQKKHQRGLRFGLHLGQLHYVTRELVWWSTRSEVASLIKCDGSLVKSQYLGCVEEYLGTDDRRCTLVPISIEHMVYFELGGAEDINEAALLMAGYLLLMTR